MEQQIEKLVWIDLEMTGLDFVKDKIIEIAVVITDTNLKIVDEKGYLGYVKLSRKDLNRISPELKAIFAPNQIIEKSKSEGKGIKIIEQEVLKYISTYVPEKCSPMCGSNIFTDRAFVASQMPRVSNYLHYRNLDVSTVRQLLKMWKILERYTLKERHNAMDDIKESIEEMTFYRRFFKS